jgi:hypothetical protein
MLILYVYLVFSVAPSRLWQIIQNLKIQNGCEGKGKHCCGCGNTILSSIVPFSFVFEFKETSVRLEISRRREEKNESASWLRAQAAEFCDIGIQKLVPRPNKCLDKSGDYVEK